MNFCNSEVTMEAVNNLFYSKEKPKVCVYMRHVPTLNWLTTPLKA